MKENYYYIYIYIKYMYIKVCIYVLSVYLYSRIHRQVVMLLFIVRRI